MQNNNHETKEEVVNGTSPHLRKRRSNRIFPHTPKHRDSSLTHRNDPLHGFYNLTYLLLLAASLQLVIKHYYQYGILIDLTFASCVWGDLAGAIVVAALMYVHSFSTFIIIKGIVTNVISQKFAMFVYSGSQVLLYVVPIRIVFARQMAPLMGGLLVLLLVVYSLKMHSYFATNLILLKKFNRGRKVDELFPSNVTFSDYLYFLAAPTLVYETYYPRNENIRYLFAIKNLFGCVVCLLIAQFVCAQFILPVLVERTSGALFFDVIRLSIPSIIAWLLGFYAFFHCWLNAIGELIRFGDREFYKDWWNATSLDIFWKKWNILVHEWLLRHVYLESVRTAKASTLVATIYTFLFSAIYHELIFFVAFRVLRPWFFLAMFLQIPMIMTSRWLYANMSPQYRDFWGNMNVWLGFFVGQPLIEILYLREWFLSNPSLICIPNPSIQSWFF